MTAEDTIRAALVTYLQDSGTRFDGYLIRVELHPTTRGKLSIQTETPSWARKDVRVAILKQTITMLDEEIRRERV